MFVISKRQQIAENRILKFFTLDLDYLRLLLLGLHRCFISLVNVEIKEMEVFQ